MERHLATSNHRAIVPDTEMATSPVQHPQGPRSAALAAPRSVGATLADFAGRRQDPAVLLIFASWPGQRQPSAKQQQDTGYHQIEHARAGQQLDADDRTGDHAGHGRTRDPRRHRQRRDDISRSEGDHLGPAIARHESTLTGDRPDLQPMTRLIAPGNWP